MHDPAEPNPIPTDPVEAHFARRLRELRAGSGLTQGQVAERIDGHESAVSRWENGTRFPTMRDLVALADLFQVSTDDLLGRTVQHAAAGAALVDRPLLDQLEAAATTAEFDRVIEAHRDHALWIPVPAGAVLMPVTEAMRRADRIARRHGTSRYADRLFRPRM
ncbi:MAG: hypothetical protein RIT25_926 [Planctomycetota bacterium]